MFLHDIRHVAISRIDRVFEYYSMSHFFFSDAKAEGYIYIYISVSIYVCPLLIFN